MYARMTSTDMSGKEKIHVNIGTKIIHLHDCVLLCKSSLSIYMHIHRMNIICLEDN